MLRVHARNGPDMPYALKVEVKREIETKQKIRMEVKVLTDIARRSPEERQHFPELIGRGSNNEFLFYVMTLLGSSLKTLHRQYGCKRFLIQISNRFLALLYSHFDQCGASVAQGSRGVAQGRIHPPRRQARELYHRRRRPREAHSE